jgi:predicted aspartyl protease
MHRAAILFLLPLAAAAGAGGRGQDPETIAHDSRDVHGSVLALGVADTRLTVPVTVAARGPYPFIIDTGAERTVVSRELAEALGLSRAAPVTLTTMTGRSIVETAQVPELAVDATGIRHSLVAPRLEGRHLGAAGLLGIDTLRNNRVTIDLVHGEMTVRPSSKRPRPAPRDPDEIVVTAKNLFGQLIVTDAYYRNTRIQVVLDTGSEVTVGNSALRRRLMARHSRNIVPVEMTGVTGLRFTADYVRVPDVRIGDILFDTVAIAFADVAPFERFQLTQRPALLLGMDALRSFRRVDIDFPNREVRFLLPEGVRHDTQVRF